MKNFEVNKKVIHTYSFADIVALEKWCKENMILLT
jgi:hypothetical protein